MHKAFQAGAVLVPQTSRQGGVTLVEMLMALLPVILIASLCIELARGYQIRQLLTLSLQDAARVAAVHQGNAHIWQPALRDALSPLFVPAGRFATPQARREATRQAFQEKFGLPLWQAVRLVSTQETIHLRLTYLHSPMQEWLRILLGTLFGLRADSERTQPRERILERSAWRLGLIPIVIEYKIFKHRSIDPA